ncbi:MAG: cysteine methyltransferase [Chloroflexi bacterium]|jgi:O-6-methylguanine DNA methyltransferase|nr:cysteine methyltransferase [Chloroflexota bacterium]|tara:strand:- start:595 stop:1113 length:519 start_codon:yes stop_codon:yes gene_type:complete
MSRFSYYMIQSPVGWVALLGSERGLVRLSLKPTPQEALEELGPDVEEADNDPSSFKGVLSCLERYMEGDAGALDEIELDLSDAPPFFGRAWAACRRIPAGETRSYAWLAAEAGSPLAVRAAGQSMARNRFVLIVPCHRVIASDGDLRGYGAGGLTVKADLLKRERAGAAKRR